VSARTRLAGPPVAVAAAVAGALCIAFSAIFVRLADVAPATAAVFRCAYALPVLAVLAARENRRFGRRDAASRRFGVVAGLFFALDLLFWHTAIGYVGAGLSTVLANLQVVLVALVAWAVLGERPHARVLAAVPVVLTGVVGISGVVGAGAYGDNPALGVLFGVLTAIAYAGFLLTLRVGNADRRRPAGPLLDATATAAVTAAVLGPVFGGVDLVPSWPAHGWLLLLALNSQVLGWLLISVSLPRLPAAVTSVVLMLQPTTAVLLGMLLLAESPSALQLAGVAVVVGGVALAATARGRSATAAAP
jgi:drug/metabolite transporter (DMT)-like permease